MKKKILSGGTSTIKLLAAIVVQKGKEQSRHEFNHDLLGSVKESREEMRLQSFATSK